MQGEESKPYFVRGLEDVGGEGEQLLQFRGDEFFDKMPRVVRSE